MHKHKTKRLWAILLGLCMVLGLTPGVVTKAEGIESSLREVVGESKGEETSKSGENPGSADEGEDEVSDSDDKGGFRILYATADPELASNREVYKIKNGSNEHVKVGTVADTGSLKNIFQEYRTVLRDNKQVIDSADFDPTDLMIFNLGQMDSYLINPQSARPEMIEGWRLHSMEGTATATAVMNPMLFEYPGRSVMAALWKKSEAPLTIEGKDAKAYFYYAKRDANFNNGPNDLKIKSLNNQTGSFTYEYTQDKEAGTLSKQITSTNSVLSDAFGVIQDEYSMKDDGSFDKSRVKVLTVLDFQIDPQNFDNEKHATDSLLIVDLEELAKKDKEFANLVRNQEYHEDQSLAEVQFVIKRDGKIDRNAAFGVHSKEPGQHARYWIKLFDLKQGEKIEVIAYSDMKMMSRIVPDLDKDVAMFGGDTDYEYDFYWGFLKDKNAYTFAIDPVKDKDLEKAYKENSKAKPYPYDNAFIYADEKGQVHWFVNRHVADDIAADDRLSTFRKENRLDVLIKQGKPQIGEHLYAMWAVKAVFDANGGQFDKLHNKQIGEDQSSNFLMMPGGADDAGKLEIAVPYKGRVSKGIDDQFAAIPSPLKEAKEGMMFGGWVAEVNGKYYRLKKHLNDALGSKVTIKGEEKSVEREVWNGEFTQNVTFYAEWVDTFYLNVDVIEVADKDTDLRPGALIYTNQEENRTKSNRLVIPFDLSYLHSTGKDVDYLTINVDLERLKEELSKHYGSTFFKDYEFDTEAFDSGKAEPYIEWEGTKANLTEDKKFIKEVQVKYNSEFNDGIMNVFMKRKAGGSRDYVQVTFLAEDLGFERSDDALKLKLDKETSGEKKIPYADLPSDIAQVISKPAAEPHKNGDTIKVNGVSRLNPEKYSYQEWEKLVDANDRNGSEPLMDGYKLNGRTFTGWYDIPQDKVKLLPEKSQFGEDSRENHRIIDAKGKLVKKDIKVFRDMILYAGYDTAPIVTLNFGYNPAKNEELSSFSYSVSRSAEYVPYSKEYQEFVRQFAVPNRPDYIYTDKSQETYGTKIIYEFDGWYYSKDFGGAPVDLKSTVFSENTVLYGKWVTTFRITFHANNGTGKSLTSEIVYKEGDRIQFPSTDKDSIFHRDGYYVRSWQWFDALRMSHDSDGIARSAEKHLYANWEAGKPVFITWNNINPNMDKDDVDNSFKEGGVGRKLGDTVVEPSKNTGFYIPDEFPGFKFAGWFKDKELTQELKPDDILDKERIAYFGKWIQDLDIQVRREGMGGFDYIDNLGIKVDLIPIKPDLYFDPNLVIRIDFDPDEKEEIVKTIQDKAIDKLDAERKAQDKNSPDLDADDFKTVPFTVKAYRANDMSKALKLDSVNIKEIKMSFDPRKIFKYNSDQPYNSKSSWKNFDGDIKQHEVIIEKATDEVNLSVPALGSDIFELFISNDAYEKVSVSFDLRGGTPENDRTGDFNERNIDLGSKIDIPDVKLKRNENNTTVEFLGWSDKNPLKYKVDEADRYQPGQNVGPIEEDTVFYALWADDGSFKLEFEGATGFRSSDAKSRSDSDEEESKAVITLKANEKINSGPDFIDFVQNKVKPKWANVSKDENLIPSGGYEIKLNLSEEALKDLGLEDDIFIIDADGRSKSDLSNLFPLPSSKLEEYIDRVYVSRVMRQKAVKFDANGGKFVIDGREKKQHEVPIKADGKVDPPDHEKVLKSKVVKGREYQFTGWYKDSAATIKVDFDKEKFSDKDKLYAGWKPKNMLTVYFKLMGNNFRLPDGGDEIRKPIKVFVEKGTPDKPGTPITNELLAELLQDKMGEDTMAEIKYIDVEKAVTRVFINDPEQTILNGELLMNLKGSGNALDSNEIFKDGYVELYYEYVENPISITYDINCDHEFMLTPKPKTVERGDVIRAPLIPDHFNPGVRKGYTFKGWYRTPEDAEFLRNKVQFPFNAYEDMTLIAGWEGDPVYIIFRYNNGFGNETRLVRIGDELPEPTYVNPKWPGMELEGWFVTVRPDYAKSPAEEVRDEDGKIDPKSLRGPAANFGDIVQGPMLIDAIWKFSEETKAAQDAYRKAQAELQAKQIAAAQEAAANAPEDQSDTKADLPGGPAAETGEADYTVIVLLLAAAAVGTLLFRKLRH